MTCKTLFVPTPSTLLLSSVNHGHDGLHAGIHDLGRFKSLVEWWNEGWDLECLTAGGLGCTAAWGVGGGLNRSLVFLCGCTMRVAVRLLCQALDHGHQSSECR